MKHPKKSAKSYQNIWLLPGNIRTLWSVVWGVEQGKSAKSVLPAPNTNKNQLFTH
jgi:hypothetical protein